MLVLAALAFLGLLQSLFVAAGFRGRWKTTCLYCVLPGLLVFAVHHWVLQLNFNRFTDYLMSDAVASGIASLLILEAIVKGFCLIDRSDNSPTGRHWLQRTFNSLANKVEHVLPYCPSLMLIFAIVYGQAWLFHTIEGHSYQTLSLTAAVAINFLFAVGITLLRGLSQQHTFDRINYELLFLQFVIAIALPLFAKDALNTPKLYSSSIYQQAALTCSGMLVICLMGYLTHTFFKKRNHSK